MTYSDRSKAFLKTEPHRQLNHRGLVTAFYERILSLGLHRDVIPEGTELDGYKLLLTPFLHYLSDEFISRAEAFVEAGGVWVVGPLTGGRTEQHTIHADAGLGKRLESLAGVETLYTYPMEGTGTRGHAFGVSAPLGLWSALFEPKEASVLGTAEGGLAPGAAFLTERAYGSGKIVMLGSMPTGEEGDALLMRLIEHYASEAGVSLRTDVTRGTVVAPRNGDGFTIWVIVNMDGGGGRVTVPQAGTDALSGEDVPPGVLEIGAYGYRVLRFPNR